MRVVTVAQMREIEARAEQEYGLTGTKLMEVAGRNVAEAVRARFGGDVTRRETLTLVGPGNNGGDGRVMARYLAQWGARSTLYAWKERRLEVGAQYIPVNDDLAAVREALTHADIVVDALLGIGATRPLDERMRALLRLVAEERERRPEMSLLALDAPTGVNCDTGAVDEGAIRADVTVTLAYPKVGLFVFPGGGYIGELVVGEIGLPAEMEVEAALDLLEAQMLRPLLPARPLDSNKGTYGKVMIVAGSLPYPGSAYLAATAAGRVGAGLVTLAVPPELAPIYAAKLSEATFHLMPPADAAPEERAASLLSAAQGSRAMVVGPGLGQGAATRDFLERLFDGLRALPDAERPRLLVDADGLNNLAQMEGGPSRLPYESVVTPHPGEMTRLRGGERVSGGGADRMEVAREAARAWGVVALLKGAATVIAAPDSGLRINWPGNPALATAGTGDALSGTIGGLLAQGMRPFDAASAGVFLHAQAGRLVSERVGDAGLLAGDLLDQLPVALRQVKQRRPSAQAMMTPARPV